MADEAVLNVNQATKGIKPSQFFGNVTPEMKEKQHTSADVTLMMLRVFIQVVCSALSEIADNGVKITSLIKNLDYFPVLVVTAADAANNVVAITQRHVDERLAEIKEKDTFLFEVIFNCLVPYWQQQVLNKCVRQPENSI